MTKKTYSKRGKLINDCTSSEQSSAAKVIAGNADLLTEILFRVPAKSLIRFKCVSKHWLSLISDSQFTSDHARLNLRSSISGLYFYLNHWSRNHDEQLESVSVDGHPSLPTLSFLDAAVAGFTIRIEDSCNGLMLCSNAYGRLAYVVCNPTTQKYTVLPGPDRPPYKTFSTYLGAFLAFDPSKSPHYKVFLFNYFYPGDGHCYEIEIYRSESSSWKYIRVAAPPGEQFAFRVFWNGAIHWISYEELDIRHIRFEVESEKLIETPMPQNPKILSHDKIRYFGECGGHLLLIQTRQRSAMGFRILEMDRECCHWIVKCRVNLRPILSVFPEIVCTTITRSCKFNVLCVVKGANEKDFTLVLAIPGKVISYNMKSKTSKDLRDLSPGELDDGGATWYNTYQFIESLSPV